MTVFAYLDPGTGTLIVQAVLGGVAGVAVLFKTVGGRFRRKNKTEDITPTAETIETDEPSAPPITSD